MAAESSENSSNPFLFQMDKKNPMRIAWLSLIFIYIFQYPLSQIMPDVNELPQYHWGDWLMAYGFVLCSVAVFMPALFVGLSGRPVKISHKVMRHTQSRKRMKMPWVIAVFALFGFWSYVMVDLKIGMTIYADFDPLPYRITGFLFYGRLFLQPLILAYIAVGYSDSKLKWIVFLLLISLGAWVSLASGSRFAAIMFVLPLALLFRGRKRYTIVGIFFLTYIIIASLSRTFYLPFAINDVDLIRIYGSELAQEQSSEIDVILLLPFSYIVSRSMGISEVLLILKFGDIAPSFTDSLNLFISYFLPLIPQSDYVSIKNIYGLSDDAFGGFGLGFFPNYWFAFGGSPILYLFGLALVAWLLGRTYRLFAIGMARLGLNELSILVFMLLFILIFEARAYLFSILFLVGWFFSRKETARIVLSFLGASTSRHTFRQAKSFEPSQNT
jgi:hypothetical protein